MWLKSVHKRLPGFPTNKGHITLLCVFVLSFSIHPLSLFLFVAYNTYD